MNNGIKSQRGISISQILLLAISVIQILIVKQWNDQLFMNC